MKNLKAVSIHKPQATASFQVGECLYFGKEKSEIKVTSIKVCVFFSRVVIATSDGNKMVFRGFPITYDVTK